LYTNKLQNIFLRVYIILLNNSAPLPTMPVYICMMICASGVIVFIIEIDTSKTAKGIYLNKSDKLFVFILNCIGVSWPRYLWTIYKYSFEFLYFGKII